MVNTEVFGIWGPRRGKGGGGEGNRTPGPLHAKPAPKVSDRHELLESFISDKNSTKGLTVRGEEWLRETLSRFLSWLPVPVEDVGRTNIVDFLALYDAKPWRKHSFYRALRSFGKWVSINHEQPNPFIDRFGNLVIEAPKTPNDVLYTMTPDSVKSLIAAATTTRDKAIISLLADSGVRRGELTSIQVADLDVERRRIKVQGKGGKEG